MDDFCFVIQPFDSGKFDQRYREIIKPAIEACGLTAYRVDEDFKVDVPVSAIESGLLNASVVIAEITTDSPNVWFEVGYAFAKLRPVILLCSDERTTRIPFDVRHRNFLRYRTGSPGDYEDFRKKLEAFITARYTGPDELTVEELSILKFISRDQMFPSAITPEDKIRESLSQFRESLSHIEVMKDCLRSLVSKDYLGPWFSTTDNRLYYRITEKAEKLLYHS